MRNLKKEKEWQKEKYKRVNLTFRKDIESELIDKLENQAKKNSKTLTEYCKNIIVKNS